MRITRPYRIIVIAVAVATLAFGCGRSSRSTMDTLGPDALLLSGEDVFPDGDAFEDMTPEGETIAMPETAFVVGDTLTYPASFSDTLAVAVSEDPAGPLDSLQIEEASPVADAGPRAATPKVLYEDIMTFVSQNGADGMYVFSEDHTLTAPGISTAYTLVALSAKDGLWAAVAPGGDYDKMEKVRLEATEDGAATLEKVLGYLKQEQKFGPQQ